MEMLWCFINALQLIHFIPMMKLYFPSHARVVFSYISIVNMDNVVMKSIFELIFDLGQIDRVEFEERFTR